MDLLDKAKYYGQQKASRDPIGLALETATFRAPQGGENWKSGKLDLSISMQSTAESKNDPRQTCYYRICCS